MEKLEKNDTEKLFVLKNKQPQYDERSGA